MKDQLTEEKKEYYVKEIGKAEADCFDSAALCGAYAGLALATLPVWPISIVLALGSATFGAFSYFFNKKKKESQSALDDITYHSPLTADQKKEYYLAKGKQAERNFNYRFAMGAGFIALGCLTALVGGTALMPLGTGLIVSGIPSLTTSIADIMIMDNANTEANAHDAAIESFCSDITTNTETTPKDVKSGNKVLALNPAPVAKAA